MTELTEFQKKALQFDKHIALTANAGSGKTFVLAKRYVQIALDANLSLSKLIAITFTDKAAGELYARISREINERLALAESRTEKAKLKRLRSELVSANISTIHAFCSSLIREFAPQVGVDTNFTQIDDRQDTELLDVTLENFVEESLKKSEENDVRKLIRFFGSVKNFIEQLKKLLRDKNNVDKVLPFYLEKSEEEIAAFYRNAFTERVKRVWNPNFEELPELFAPLLEALLAKRKAEENVRDIKEKLDKLSEASDIIDKIKITREIFRTGIFTQREIRLNRKKMQGFDRALIATFEDGIKKFAEMVKIIDLSGEPKAVEKSLAGYAKLIVKVYNRVVSEYERKKRINGFLNFEDLLRYAAEILKNDETRRFLAKRYDYIMVDEFQDTNEIQYEIIMPLLENLTRGNLFVVGDEKQSIYMFRNAELRIFKEAKEEIGNKAESGTVLELPHSFRLAPNLALFTNYVFKRLFANPVAEFNEVAHNDLICARGENEQGEIGILLAGEDRSEETLTAHKILDLKNKGEADFKDIAVLCRKRKHFAPLMREFLRLDIPFTIVGSKGFYQNQIVEDIYNFLAFVSDESNDVALTGILRSPFFYLSDRKLFEISREKGNYFYEKLRAFGAKDKKVENIVKLLSRFKRLASELPLNEFIRTLLIESNYLAVISSRHDSQIDFANIEKLISIANEFSNNSFGTFYDFVEYLRKSVEEYEDEEEAEILKSENKVKIMTVHAAKGLEFPVVFLFKGGEAGTRFSIKEKEIYFDKEFGIVAKVPLANDNFYVAYKTPPATALYSYYRLKKESAENKRVFYVAVTRARDKLFISGGAKKGENSFLSMLGTVFGEEWNEILSLKGMLKFMDNAGKIVERELELEIPIIRSFDEVEKEEASDKKTFTIRENLASEIIDFPENEIFSATRIVTYSFCPLKYKLVYELGYGKLLKLLDESKILFDGDEVKEEPEELPPNVRGSIIHLILEKNIKDDELNDFISAQFVNFGIDVLAKASAVQEIKTTVGKFRDSEIFKNLSRYERFENEFSIYLRQDNFFLYGILDKLILTPEKVIIVDYKTDYVPKGGGGKKYARYEKQLLFYAFIVKEYLHRRKMDVPSIFELRLLFVGNPEESVVKVKSIGEVEDFGKVIYDVITKIQKRNFPPNLANCRQCQFYLNGKCVAGSFSHGDAPALNE